MLAAILILKFMKSSTTAPILHWPENLVRPRITGAGAFRDVYTVMANWGANHGAISYGHIGADLIALASILRIPVCMHNVDEDKIFRPSAWNAFGMDKEGIRLQGLFKLRSPLREYRAVNLVSRFFPLHL